MMVCLLRMMVFVLVRGWLLGVHAAVFQYPSYTLVPGSEISSSQLPPGAHLASFCYRGRPPSLIALWNMVRFSLHVGSDRFQLYSGTNHSDVIAKYETASGRFFNLMPWRERTLRLPPFFSTCVGVDTNEPYRVSLEVRQVDYSLVLTMGIGLLLFVWADRLSRNVAFHYSSGVAVGVLGAVLIAVYLLSRLVPRRGGAYAILLTGWSLSIYFLQFLLDNARTYVQQYRGYILGYLITSGVLSFAVCYRYGPVTDDRTKTLIRWFLQLVGLTMVYFSGNVPELNMALVLVLVVWRVVPRQWARCVSDAVRHRLVKPEPRRLLTDEEYRLQASKTTQKELQELRKYCRSPDCDAWRTMSRLGTPLRFANFVAGDSHLSDDELLKYELDCSSPNGESDDFMTSDDDS